jgi:hypothetical protein
MISFFGSDPIEQERDEEYWKYETKEDSDGVKVVFSFNVMESTVEANLFVRGKPSYEFSQGLATKIEISYRTFPLTPGSLYCFFYDGLIVSRLEILIEPFISLSWSYSASIEECC